MSAPERPHGCACSESQEECPTAGESLIESCEKRAKRTPGYGCLPLGTRFKPVHGIARSPTSMSAHGPKREAPARPRPASQPLRGLTSSRLLLQRILASLMHRFGFTVQYLQIPDCYYLNSGQAFRKLHFGAISHGFAQQRPGDRGIDGDEPLGGIGLIHTYDAVIDLPFR